MILYFSATGNCKYVATRLTQAIGQEIHSIVDCIRNGQYDFSDDTVGVISPTYDWGLLSIMKEFLEKASFQTDYLYFIATYGTTHGAIGYMANKAIRGKTINAFYVVRMVDIWTPIFDLSTPEKIAKYTKKTEARIDRVIRDISKRRINRHMPPAPGIHHRMDCRAAISKKCATHFTFPRGGQLHRLRTVRKEMPLTGD